MYLMRTSFLLVTQKCPGQFPCQRILQTKMAKVPRMKTAWSHLPSTQRPFLCACSQRSKYPSSLICIYLGREEVTHYMNDQEFICIWSVAHAAGPVVQMGLYLQLQTLSSFTHSTSCLAPLHQITPLSCTFHPQHLVKICGNLAVVLTVPQSTIAKSLFPRIAALGRDGNFEGGSY